jgi:formylglycine-generating enzyme
MTIVACACALALASGAALAQPKSTRRPGAAVTASKKKSLAAPQKPGKDPKKRTEKNQSNPRADQEKSKGNSRREKADKSSKDARKGADRSEARSATPSKSAPSKSARGKRQASRRAGDAGAGRARRPLSSPPPHTPPPPPRASLPILEAAIRCPADMVAVAGRVCVDRYEASLVSRDTGADLSPYYPPSPALAASLFTIWSGAREAAPSGTLARILPIPALPEGAAASFLARAIAEAGRVPSGYTSGAHAAEACRGAGKRLCSEVEWVTACRGEAQTPFPYGAVYRQDACNVFREEHPAHVLHGTFSANHLDPRLNQIEVGGRPLLRKTGDTPSCASRWGDDAIFDMVGNLDEWIDDPGGTFVGGFYARATRRGCDARIAGHPIDYLDYSTGVRCCKDPDP